jgi:hypothetical protein
MPNAAPSRAGSRNWRTTAVVLDLLVEVVRELGAKTVSAT